MNAQDCPVWSAITQPTKPTNKVNNIKTTMRTTPTPSTVNLYRICFPNTQTKMQVIEFFSRRSYSLVRKLLKWSLKKHEKCPLKREWRSSGPPWPLHPGRVPPSSPTSSKVSTFLPGLGGKPAKDIRKLWRAGSEIIPSFSLTNSRRPTFALLSALHVVFLGRRFWGALAGFSKEETGQEKEV